MLVTKDSLPSDPVQRAIRLRDYFCDKDARADESDAAWKIQLYWSNDPYRYVDPNIRQALEWWRKDTDFEDIALARRRDGKIMLALYDTWTLESWSHWLSMTNPEQITNVTILHIDDHRDLGSPRLMQDATGWRDLITGHPVDLMKPDSISNAIESGAIGMGSFLTPFLYHLPTAEVRHLCQPPKCLKTQDFKIILSEAYDDLLNSQGKRPTIDLQPCAFGTGHGTYRYTSSMTDWLSNLSDGPLLLHIDLDYFCNRFDGDSDAIEYPKPLNPNLQDILRQVEVLGEALRNHHVFDQLEDIVIAFSPGFFPAEFWRPVSEALILELGDPPCRQLR